MVIARQERELEEGGRRGGEGGGWIEEGEVTSVLVAASRELQLWRIWCVWMEGFMVVG